MSDTDEVVTIEQVMAEHRRCGPKYEGCYSHWSLPHCRADGMAWPCDVEAIRSVVRAARLVAIYWRDALLRLPSQEPLRAGTHPLAMVLAALDGETDPVYLGIDNDYGDAFRAELNQSPNQSRSVGEAL